MVSKYIISIAKVADDGRLEIWGLFINNLERRRIHFDKIDKKTNNNSSKTRVKWHAKFPVIV